jgi:hypothetical protein
MTSLMPGGYRSATEYCFDDEQTDAIVRTTAYHRRDYCLSVIWYSPREHIDIRPSIATPFQRTSNIGVGSLGRLPLELLFDTLYRLDMHSLFKFRQINLRSRQIVDSLSQYQNIVSHGLNLFCALLRTRLAIDISLLDFYNALCIKACTFCGEFGGFISLLIWKRCRFKCLQQAPETQVRTLASVRKQFHMTKAELDQLRSFKSVPGIYSMTESVQILALQSFPFTRLPWFAETTTTYTYATPTGKLGPKSENQLYGVVCASLLRATNWQSGARNFVCRVSSGSDGRTYHSHLNSDKSILM